jgi:hypothetical protein
MRWIPLLLLALLLMALQMTLAQLIRLPTPFGPVGPVLAASAAVFIGLFCRRATDAALAGWILGVSVDLTVLGDVPAAGLLGLLFLLATAAVHRLREAFFTEHAGVQFLMGLLLTGFVLETWTIYQAVFGDLPRADLGKRAIQAGGVALYTALVTPLVCLGLRRLRSLLFARPPGRERR